MTREQGTGNRNSRCRAAGLRGKPRGNDRYYNHFTMYAAAPSSQQRPSPDRRPPKAFPFRGRWQPEGLTEEVPRPPNRDQALPIVPQSLPLQGKVAARRADGRGSRHFNIFYYNAQKPAPSAPAGPAKRRPLDTASPCTPRRTAHCPAQPARSPVPCCLFPRHPVPLFPRHPVPLFPVACCLFPVPLSLICRTPYHLLPSNVSIPSNWIRNW